MGGFVTAYALLKDFGPTVGFEKVFREPPPNLSHAIPLVTVARFGGGDDALVIDQQRIQVDVFASTADTAEQLGEDLRTALRLHLPRYTFGGAVVGRVQTMSAPQLVPWAASGIFRSAARYQLTVHQYSGIS